jgi:hypothetical protein
VAEAIQPLHEEALSYRVCLERATDLDPAPHAPLMRGRRICMVASPLVLASARRCHLLPV